MAQTAAELLGAFHLLSGLYDAKMDHQPLAAIVGQVIWEMRAQAGDPELQASPDLPDFPCAACAEAPRLAGRTAT